ncbi:MAG TPA: hypothetical protein VFH48_30800 [Chloroflexota bacterium]|nr:hypothetical protein [Chloroflexota bacterium]
MRTEAGEGEIAGEQRPTGRGNRSGFHTLLASLIAIGLVAAAFGMTVARATALEIHTHPPRWVVEAIPAALSELYFQHSYRYTVLTSVRERFDDPLPERNVTAKHINLAIRKVSEIKSGRVGSSYTLLGPDDKGIVDLIRISFQLFGFRAENVTTLYFVILFGSCLVYVVAFWWSTARLLLLAAYLALMYLTLPMVTYNAQLTSILALRALPVLSIVACLHCLLFMAGSLRERPGAFQIVLVAVQVTLIAFTMHLRTTTLWQLITIVGFGVVVLIVASVRRIGIATVAWRWTGLAVGSTILFVVTGYVGLQAYQAATLPEEYRRGDQIATRVFWHNIFSGFAYHPVFSERYQLRVDDASVFAAARDYLAETGRYDVWLAMGGEDAVEFQALNFTRYEPIAREMLFARCTTYLRECAETMLYYKPLSLMGNLAWLHGLHPLPPDLEVVVSRRAGGEGEVKQQYIAATQQMDAHGHRAYFWTPVVLLVIMPFAVLLVRESRPSVWTALAGAVGLTFGSTFPTVIGYPLPHTILDTAVAVGILTYFGIVLATATWLRVLSARGWPFRPKSEAPTPLPTTVS